MRGEDENEVGRLLKSFAQRTGVGGAAPRRRYLWTDAYAVMTALALAETVGEQNWRDLARRLIDDVHHTLARHRDDDPRSGWISGLAESEGARRPTAGGLRIGKPFPERAPDEPFDEALEWDRDGQYLHYLTKWMEALSRAADAFGAPDRVAEAAALAEASFAGFLVIDRQGEPRGLFWKMSVDLSRPQVAALSPHDALDGFVTFRGLTARDGREALHAATATLLRLCLGRRWRTEDPLGLGGLLSDAARLAALTDRTTDENELLAAVLSDAANGVDSFAESARLDRPAPSRLAFRELGLAIGLFATPAMADALRLEPASSRVAQALADLETRQALAERIVDFWNSAATRSNPTWREHEDINDVMLAAALLRERFHLRGGGSGATG